MKTRTRALLFSLTVLLLPSGAEAEPTTPQLRLVDLEGRPTALATYRGEVVLVNFWATWCLPCRAELPLLEKLSQDYADSGVRFIAASADDQSTLGEVRPALDEAGITFDTWTGATTLDMQRLGVGTALPATAIIDRNGIVAARILGPVTESTLREHLDRVIGRTPTSEHAADHHRASRIIEADPLLADHDEAVDHHDHADHIEQDAHVHADASDDCCDSGEHEDEHQHAGEHVHDAHDARNPHNHGHGHQDENDGHAASGQVSLVPS